MPTPFDKLFNDKIHTAPGTGLRKPPVISDPGPGGGPGPRPVNPNGNQTQGGQRPGHRSNPIIRNDAIINLMDMAAMDFQDSLVKAAMGNAPTYGQPGGGRKPTGHRKPPISGGGQPSSGRPVGSLTSPLQLPTELLLPMIPGILTGPGGRPAYPLGPGPRPLPISGPGPRPFGPGPGPRPFGPILDGPFPFQPRFPQTSNLMPQTSNRLGILDMLFGRG